MNLYNQKNIDISTKMAIERLTLQY